MDTRGSGEHKDIINKMKQGDERDKNLVQLLSDVVNKNGDRNEDDDDQNTDTDNDNADDYDGSDRTQETSPQETSPDETSPDESSKCSDTSAYTDNITSTSAYDLSLEEKCDVNALNKDGKRDVNAEEKSDAVDQPNEDNGKRDVNTEEKRDVNAEQEKLEEIQTPLVNCAEEGSVIEITPQQQVLQQQVTNYDDIIDLSGRLIIDANTGNAYNIDDIDISQFTDMYVVSPNDDPLQDYQKVTIQLLEDDDIKKENDGASEKILQEIEIQQKIQEGTSEEKRDVTTQEVPDDAHDGCDAKDTDDKKADNDSTGEGQSDEKDNSEKKSDVNKGETEEKTSTGEGQKRRKK